MNRYHFIGIGGIGMSALAHILRQKGIQVSGSDLKIAGLEKQDFEQDDQVIFVYSTAIPKDHPELLWAEKHHKPILHRSELLAELLREKFSLLVAGTHGKTSTSGLLAWVLKEAKIDPSFVVGGIINGLDQNGHHGSSDYFVAEADESDGSFLNYAPYGAILTGTEEDHLDYWKSQTSMREGYLAFLSKVAKDEFLFWCSDDPYLQSVNPRGISYGTMPGSDLHITDIHEEANHVLFTIEFEGNKYSDIEFSIIGKHQALNAAAVFGMALRIGIAEETIRLALKTFPGMKRRSELKGEINQIAIYDDYAHHPTEIITTLHAFRIKAKKNRLVTVFQPHRYSRTRDMMDDFAKAFSMVDELIVTDIFPSGEKPIQGITAEKLLQKIKQSGQRKAQFIAHENLVPFLTDFVRPKDVVITLGAGNITEIGGELIKKL